MSADRPPRDAKRLLEDLLRPYLGGSQIPIDKSATVAVAAAALTIREGLDNLANEIARERG